MTYSKEFLTAQEQLACKWEAQVRNARGKRIVPKPKELTDEVVRAYGLNERGERVLPIEELILPVVEETPRVILDPRGHRHGV